MKENILIKSGFKGIANPPAYMAVNVHSYSIWAEAAALQWDNTKADHDDVVR